MAARDPVLEELMRNGGARADGDMKRDASTSSSISLEVRSEDIGE